MASEDKSIPKSQNQQKEQKEQLHPFLSFDFESRKEKDVQKPKSPSLSDPRFRRKVIEAIESGHECFEDDEYGHVCADRIWSEQ